MKPKKYAYKLVFVDDFGQLLSVCTKATTMCFHPEKTTHRWPNCGPISVFNTRKNAMAFMDSDNGGKKMYSRHQIWECEIKESKDKTLWNSNGEVEDSNFPNGTIFCDSVKLIYPFKR